MTTKTHTTGRPSPRSALIAAFGLAAALLGTLVLLLDGQTLYAEPGPAGIRGPAPALTWLAPDSGPNNMDMPVVITGTDFISTPTVALGGAPLESVVWVSATRLTALIPWGFPAGTYDLTVINPGPEALSATLTGAFTVTQAIGTWTTEGPYGGSVHHVVMDETNPSTLYASLGLAGADGFFKSEDGGESWSNAFPGKISVRTPLAGFALKPGDAQTIYLSGRVETGDKLFRSVNGGGDWEEIWTGGDGYYAIGVSAADPEVLYVASGATVKLSNDSGDSWNPADGGIPGDASVSVLAIHPVTPAIAYAGIEPGLIYKTVNSGGAWTQVADLGEGWWSVLAVDPHAPERVYASGWHTGAFFARSLNGGTTWEPMTLEPDSLSVNDIAFHPTISGTLYVIAPGIFRSADAGATWDKLPLPNSVAEGWSLLLHPQTGLPAYIGHNGKGVIASDNGGADWVVRSHGLAGLRPHEIAAATSDFRYVYVGADEAGGFSSNNGGQSWLSAEGEDLDRGISVAVHPYTPTIAYLGARRDVYRTVDGGQTWTRHELAGLPPANEMRVHALAIDPNDPRVVYAGPGTWDFSGGPEYGWLYRSMDAGETWAPLTTTVPISPVTDIAIDPTDSQTIYVATGRRFLDSTDRGTGILKTTDGGASWQYINEGLPARSIACLAINPEHPEVLYAGAVLESASPDSGVYKSIDGGEHWLQLIGGLRVSGLAVDPLLPDTVFMGTYDAGLFRSHDGGETWESEGGPLGRLSSESLQVLAAPDRTLIFAGVAGDLLIGETSAASGLTPALAGEADFYGGGVYQLTIDHRFLANRIYVSLVMQQ